MGRCGQPASSPDRIGRMPLASEGGDPLPGGWAGNVSLGLGLVALSARGVEVRLDITVGSMGFA